MGQPNSSSFHRWRPASLALPVCAFLSSPFILYATLDSALRTGSVNKDVNHMIHSSVTMAARRDREHVRVQNGVLTEDGMTSRRQGDQASRVTCLI